MEYYLNQLTEYLARQSWHIVVLALVIATMSLLLRNKSAHVRYLLWLILLAKCLVPPLLTIPLAILPQAQIAEPPAEPVVEMPTTPFEPLNVTQVTPVITPEPIEIAQPTLLQKLAQIEPNQWLTIAWTLGTVAFFTVVLLKALRVNNWIKNTRTPLQLTYCVEYSHPSH